MTMPADYTNLPAHIATRVAVAAERERAARDRYDFMYRTSLVNEIGRACVELTEASAELSEALREAREAERVTVEKVQEAIDRAWLTEHKPPEAEYALRAAGYTVELDATPPPGP